MESVIRWLAAIAAVASLPLIVVPIFDYDAPNPVDEPLSIAGLLGGIQIQYAGLVGAVMIVSWIALAVRLWFARPGWGWVGLLVASLLMAGFVVEATVGYRMTWDGVGPGGRPAGGMVQAVPGVGTGLLGLSVACLLTAGTLVTRRLLLRRRHAARSRKM